MPSEENENNICSILFSIIGFWSVAVWQAELFNHARHILRAAFCDYVSDKTAWVYFIVVMHLVLFV